MQFVVTGTDGSDAAALERRMAARESHLKLGDKMKEAGELLFAAATLDGNGKMAGSVMFLNFPSREALDDWLRIEPYVTGGVWKEIIVQVCKVGPSFC